MLPFLRVVCSPRSARAAKRCMDKINTVVELAALFIGGAVLAGIAFAGLYAVIATVFIAASGAPCDPLGTGFCLSVPEARAYTAFMAFIVALVLGHATYQSIEAYLKEVDAEKKDS